MYDAADQYGLLYERGGVMQQLGTWVIHVTAVALICGVVCSLVGESTLKGIVRMVCSIVLTVTAIRPLMGFSLPDFGGLMEACLDQGMEAAALGENWAGEERLELIKLGLETYILDKAAALDADLDVRVFLDEEGNPISAELHGAVSSSVRRSLEAVIAKDLGIGREDQKWTGQTRRTP